MLDALRREEHGEFEGAADAREGEGRFEVGFRSFVMGRGDYWPALIRGDDNIEKKQ